MRAASRPQLRPYLQPAQVDFHNIYLVDQLGLAETVRVSIQEFQALQLFDGQRSLEEIHRETRPPGVTLEYLQRLVHRLEHGLFLEGERFRQVAHHAVRPPRCIGCYSGDPDLLRRQLRDLFVRPGGPGLPGAGAADGTLRAALVPHIDYPRGGVSYAWGFKEIVERTDAELFVIIGTSHYSGARFTLTRKHFQTPLGVVQTDQQFIDRLVEAYGPGLFEDELLAHLPEHSIELEVVMLHYLLEERRHFRIVPLVVGSFHDCVMGQTTPLAQRDIARMIKALREVERETDEPVCYVISGDLAHIGPKFGARFPVEQDQLAHSRRQDERILERAEAVDVAGYFDVIAGERDERNICGLPPTFVALEACRPARGRLLHYDRYVHPEGHESVSFASMAFYRA